MKILTRAMAIERALDAMEPGDETEIHRVDCKMGDSGACTCKPLELVCPALPKTMGFRVPA